jgi:ADP-L-glycero-D-manno-heptose 6-epimerase
MIIVTGAAGFIGSKLALIINKQEPGEELLLVDHLGFFKVRPYCSSIEKKELFDASTFLENLKNFKDVKSVIHMGAITNTAEKDEAALTKWNVEYSQRLWNYCSDRQIPFIYASSAATYGNGSNGFADSHDSLEKLLPLNLYGKSKHTFDLWALNQKSSPLNWYGLKFFNVFGPHESHKERMASSVWHGYQEITKTSAMTLFKSHNPNYKDGDQARDFIFIEDIINIVNFLLAKKPLSGIYNCGTGEASSFIDLSNALFSNLKLSPKIKWVDTPVEFRAGYQYKTQAQTDKLRAAGYTRSFTSMPEGVAEYLQYLKSPC